MFRPEPVPIDVWVSRLGNSSFELRYEILDDGGPVYAEAATVLVPFDVAAGRPRRVSDEERAALEPFLELAMTHVELAGRVRAAGPRAVPRTTGRTRQPGSGATAGRWTGGRRLERTALRGGGAAPGCARVPRRSWTPPCRRNGCSSACARRSTVEVPPAVSGPSWVGLLPPRSGWEERMRGDVANVRAAVGHRQALLPRACRGCHRPGGPRTDRPGRLGAHLPR